MSKEIISEFEVALNEFISVLSCFSQEQFNIHPKQNSWTAGQVGEHIRKSLKRGVVLLASETKPAHRPADQLVETIKNIFTDFSKKLNSPDFIIPTDMHYDKEILIHELSQAKEIGVISRTLELSELCTAFAFPVLGNLTRLEVLNFYTYHIQRHIYQLNGISKKLGECSKIHQ
jgi:hypothetical protein